MDRKKQPKWKRLLPPVLWVGAGIGLFILLASAAGRNGQLKCKGLEIAIEGYKHEMFINEADIKTLIEDDLRHSVKGCVIDAINLRHLENLLQKDNWVSKAQLFIDNQQNLHVNISERLPVARIFTQANRSFYIDSQAVMLPLSQQQVADVPVFTNLPDRPQKLVGADSLFWQQLGRMGSYIISDSFLLMQIGQIDITPQKELELYPVIGNHIVLLGKPEKWVEKLVRLKKFDHQVLAKAGLNKYSMLDLRYDNQIVATLRGTEDFSSLPANIIPNLETAAALTSTTPEPTETEGKADNETLGKLVRKPLVQILLKETKQRLVAKKENDKRNKKPEKLVPPIVRKKSDEKNKKIIAAANNKSNKIALKQLPKSAEKTGIIEVDIRKKSNDKKSPPPRATIARKY